MIRPAPRHAASFMQIGRVILLFAAFTLIAASGQAAALRQDINLPAHFAENMVLQQGKRVVVECQTEAESLWIQFQGKPERMKKDSGTKIWKRDLGQFEAGGPSSLIILAGKKEKDLKPEFTITNVYVGDVWVWGANEASRTLRGSIPSPTNQRFASIMLGGSTNAVLAQTTDRTPWLSWSPTNAPFAAWFFAQTLANDTGIPIGVIVVDRSDVVGSLKLLPKQMWGPWTNFLDKPFGRIGEQSRAKAAERAKGQHLEYSRKLNDLKLRGQVIQTPLPPDEVEFKDFEKVYSGPWNILSPMSVRGVIR